MLGWIADVTANNPSSSEDSQMRATAVWALADWCYVADAYQDWALPEHAAEALYNRGHSFLIAYKAIAIRAVSNGQKVYAWRP
eukprot:655460-Alexandrium_andersonii.AAC.1